MKIKYTCKKKDELSTYLVNFGTDMGLYGTPFVITVNYKAFYKGDIIIINNEQLFINQDPFQIGNNTYCYLVVIIDPVKTVSFKTGDIVKKLCSSKEKD